MLEPPGYATGGGEFGLWVEWGGEGEEDSQGSTPVY